MEKLFHYSVPTWQDLYRRSHNAQKIFDVWHARQWRVYFSLQQKEQRIPNIKRFVREHLKYLLQTCHQITVSVLVSWIWRTGRSLCLFSKVHPCILSNIVYYCEISAKKFHLSLHVSLHINPFYLQRKQVMAHTHTHKHIHTHAQSKQCCLSGQEVLWKQ